MNIIKLTEQLQDFVRAHEREVTDAINDARRALVSEKARILEARRELARDNGDINDPSLYSLANDEPHTESVLESKLYIITRLSSLLNQVKDESFDIQVDALEIGATDDT